jgi:hypothetical protein
MLCFNKNVVLEHDLVPPITLFGNKTIDTLVSMIVVILCECDHDNLVLPITLFDNRTRET